ncbi:hypothetical protein QBC46DRAFT_353546 [Diplogelasinospora grovesii]|uniref:Uncharacterized protein n=1 Tax=Diplogelasinospora grovesii TaxID=303347 RepID=A0AAN6N927_9PEZI|nr:hypothetical protein QBC46DRAFT_353546 [Diplogelasinospora grovesii]
MATIIVPFGDSRLGFKDQTLWCVGIAVAHWEGKFYWTQEGWCKGSKRSIFWASFDMPPDGAATARDDIECLYQDCLNRVTFEIHEDPGGGGGGLYWTDRGELPDGNILNEDSLE